VKEKLQERDGKPKKRIDEKILDQECHFKSGVKDPYEFMD
jgi:hypothetical protein